jgi:cytochrome-b5 reductase
VLGAGIGGYYYVSAPISDSKKDGDAATVAVPAKKVFTGGDQGFVSLKLDQIENVNHNTKRFRFSFEDSDAVSGLNIACENTYLYRSRQPAWGLDADNGWQLPC